MKHMTFALILFVFGIQLASAQRWCNGPACEDRNPQPRIPTRGWCGSVDCPTRTPPAPERTPAPPTRGWCNGPSCETRTPAPKPPRRGWCGPSCKTLVNIAQDRFSIKTDLDNEQEGIVKKKTDYFYELYADNETLVGKIFLRSNTEAHISMEDGEDYPLESSEKVCPTDPKLCAYYYCYRRWPPTDCKE